MDEHDEEYSKNESSMGDKTVHFSNMDKKRQVTTTSAKSH